MEFNEETAVGVLLHPESVLPYTLTVKVLSVESDKIFANWRKLKPTKIKTDVNLWPEEYLIKE